MKETGIACLDLDEVRNVETGEIEAEALAIVKDFQSYTEVSISGTGLHIFFTLRKPLPHGSRTHRTKNRLDGYELYHDKRFMLITGDHLPGTPEDLRDRTDIAHKVFKPSGLGEYDASYSGGKCTEDAKTVLLLIRASNAAFRFFKRFRTPAIDAEDRSGIDFGMAVTIARFSNCDKSMVEQIMRMSKRVREEWNRGDYLHRTITRACAAVENERKERRNGNV